MLNPFHENICDEQGIAESVFSNFCVPLRRDREHQDVAVSVRHGGMKMRSRS